MIIDFDNLIRKLNSAGGKVRIASGVLKENIIICLDDGVAVAINKRGSWRCPSGSCAWSWTRKIQRKCCGWWQQCAGCHR